MEASTQPEKVSPVDNITEPEKTPVIKQKDHGISTPDETSSGIEAGIGHQFVMTERDYAEAKSQADNMSLDEVRALMQTVVKIHKHDPNFPSTILYKAEEFLNNDDVLENPLKHEDLIFEMKLETAIITNNSPYAEVRAVVDNHDDSTLPVSTIRAYVIGIFFAAALGFINQFFSIRQPTIFLQSNVAQLLAYPVGAMMAKVLPDVGFNLFGNRISLNPGPFNAKEHMLITIMANVGLNTPYISYIIWIQFLPMYYNQSFAGSFGYQIILALSTQFIGYGMAGICRRFLVYPSYCVWPASLVTIALNRSFHTDANPAVRGWFNKIYTISRYKYFLVAFGAMFVYFWFPDFIFQALSFFNWPTWISPSNVALTAVMGSYYGMGLNPWPTFDWNMLTSYDGVDPLSVPFFATFNKWLGCLLITPVVLAIWFTNTWYSGYIPINSNHVFDNTGALYNVSRASDSNGMLNQTKYENYSPAYMSAANMCVYICFFAIYTATLTMILLNNWFEIKMGMVNFINQFRKNKGTETGQYQDVHNRLMKKYPEVPEWWFGIVLVISIALGIAGIAGWPTNTSPGVVFYGLLLCIIFVVPVGIIKSMTGVEVTLNVLAEFLGGAWVKGNATSLNFFKSYGYVTCAHAVWFSNDLKLAHYVKIPPRHTFWAQIFATLISTFVCTAILNFQMGLEGVCTVGAPFNFTCPGNNTYFTASVFFGSIGPGRSFGAGSTYAATLLGWPLGIVVAVISWAVQRRWPNVAWLRQVHPVALLYGAMWLAPYNVSYLTPAVYIGYLSWMYTKKRHLAFWSKYNYVTSAALSTGVAMAAIIIFFCAQYQGAELDWWGNSVPYEGCEGQGGCTRFEVADGEHFGRGVGEFS